MKIIFNQLSFRLFINMMVLNIGEEHIKLIKVVNDDTFNFALVNKKIIFGNPRINFLCHVLKLTIKYAHVELYLKNLLNYFTVDELENMNIYSSILHFMSDNASVISLNSFEMVINYGVNIDNKNE